MGKADTWGQVAGDLHDALFEHSTADDLVVIEIALGDEFVDFGPGYALHGFKHC